MKKYFSYDFLLAKTLIVNKIAENDKGSQKSVAQSQL